MLRMSFPVCMQMSYAKKIVVQIISVKKERKKMMDFLWISRYSPLKPQRDAILWVYGFLMDFLGISYGFRNRFAKISFLICFFSNPYLMK